MKRPYTPPHVDQRCPPHHWKLDSHNLGVCQACGEVKQFGVPISMIAGGWIVASMPRNESERAKALARRGLSGEAMD